MKKIILTGTALLAFAAAGFAQNNATLNQVGNSQTAQQSQTGNLHNSTVSQVQGATPATTNFGNYAETVQNGSTGNTSTVNQNNGANSNAARTAQSDGTGNNATVNQNDKSGAAGVGTAITGPSSQAAVEAAGGNFGTIQQVGSTLNAMVNQNGNGTNASTGNFADVQQDGTGHNARVNQNAGVLTNANSANNNASVGQNGSRNDATVNQNNLASGNTSNITQFGSGGTAATANTVITYQNGAGTGVGIATNNNIITVNQGVSGGAVNSNNAVATQRGGSVNLNQITINQSGGNGNSAAPITPGTTTTNVTIDPTTSTGSELGVIQVGNGNVTNLTQNGSNNDANEVEAFGDNNLTNITQTGTTHRANVRMSPLRGSGNDNNNILIQQSGASQEAAFILRSKSTSLPGSPNFSAMQTGASNYARVQVYGDLGTDFGTPGLDNRFTVTQNAPGAGLADPNFRNRLNAEINGDNNVVNVDQNVTSIAVSDANTIGAYNQGTGTGVNNTNRGLFISGDYNDVDLRQNGTRNQMNMVVQGNAANIGQKNEIDVRQTGSNNRVGTGAGGGIVVDNTSARGLYVSGNSNKVDITQNGGDEVKATQDGNDKLTVNQTGGNTTATAQSNRVLLNQGAGYNEATANQTGEGNFVYGLAGANTFGSQQGGTMTNPNTLNVDQTNGGVSGMSNNAFVGQNGAGNTVNITQIKP